MFYSHVLHNVVGTLELYKFADWIVLRITLQEQAISGLPSDSQWELMENFSQYSSEYLMHFHADPEGTEARPIACFLLSSKDWVSTAEPVS